MNSDRWARMNDRDPTRSPLAADHNALLTAAFDVVGLPGDPANGGWLAAYAGKQVRWVADPGEWHVYRPGPGLWVGPAESAVVRIAQSAVFRLRAFAALFAGRERDRLVAEAGLLLHPARLRAMIEEARPRLTVATVDDLPTPATNRTP